MAAEQFIKLEDYESTAQCYFKLENYWEARSFFAKCNDPLREVDCLDKLGEYEKIIEIMSQDNEFLSEVERERFLRKYIHLMLEEMEKTIEGTNNEDVISSKTQTTTQSFKNEIQEINLDGQKNKGETTKNDEEEFNENKIEKLEETDAEEDDFAIIDEFSESFVEISINNDENSFVEIASKLTTDEKEKEKAGSEETFLNNNQIARFEVLGYQGDKKLNFIENRVIAKILKYFSNFSDDIKHILSNHRAAKALLIYNKKNLNIDSEKNEDIDGMMNDLLDKDLICLILDCLEEYGKFGLSLVICNRFSLPIQSTKFTVSMLTKHSCICETNTKVNFEDLLGSQFQFKKMTDENRFLAAQAFHNVLQNVDNKLLNRVDLDVKENTLTSQDISKFVALGFWRQCPIILPLNETLKLFTVFNAFDVCVVIWCNCLSDLQKRNNILEKFNKQKTIPEKIKYIMNEDIIKDSKKMKHITFSAFV